MVVAYEEVVRLRVFIEFLKFLCSLPEFSFVSVYPLLVSSDCLGGLDTLVAWVIEAGVVYSF